MSDVKITIDNNLVPLTVPISLKREQAAHFSNESMKLTRSGDYKKGIAYALRALDFYPESAPAHCNLSLGYWSAERYDEAMAEARRAIELAPHEPMPWLNLGTMSLAFGDYKTGWQGYARRFETVGAKLQASVPKWEGQDLGVGLLFVWAEQGIGDEILYGSFIPSLIKRGIKFIWSISERLLPLFQYNFPDVQFAVFKGPMPANSGEVTAYICAADLGAYLRPSKSSFPRTKGYLRVPPATMGKSTSMLKVGISWFSTNPMNKTDKSTKLSDWAPVFDVPGVSLVNLQYDSKPEDLDGMPVEIILDLDLTNNIEAVAQVVAACDLIITVSNSLAHLSCALGIPTWVMVGRGMGKYWYWGFRGTQTIWYPTARVFRQVDRGNWASTLQLIAKRLKLKAA